MAVEHRQLLFLTRNSANVRLMGIAVHLVCAEKQRVQRVKIGYRSYSGCTQECEAANGTSLGNVQTLVCRQEQRQARGPRVSPYHWPISRVTEEASRDWVFALQMASSKHYSRNRVYR